MHNLGRVGEGEVDASVDQRVRWQGAGATLYSYVQRATATSPECALAALAPPRLGRDGLVTGSRLCFGRMTYWYCLNHHKVEGTDGCDYKDRLCPYDTEAEAARALEKVKERNEEWDNDPRWNDLPNDRG